MKTIAKFPSPEGASRGAARRDLDADVPWASSYLALLPPLVRAAASAYHPGRGHALAPFLQRRVATLSG